MRLSRSSLALAALLTFSSVSRAVGQDADLSGGAAFLLVPIGARNTALGQAGMADGGTIESVFWNPAGLATSKHSEFAVHYANTFASNNSSLSAILVSPELGVVGLSAYLADFGSQPITTRSGSVNGRLSPKGVVLLASVATRFAGSIGVGMNYKLVQFRQDCSGSCVSPGGTRFESIVGTTRAVDIGFNYRAASPTGFAVGAAVRHAGFKLQLENREQADPLPTRLQVGVAYKILVTDLPENRLVTKILVDLAGPLRDFGDPDLHIGGEMIYGDVAFLRAGYSFVEGATSGPSVGVGLTFDNVTVDFARSFFQSSAFEDPLLVTLRVAL